MAEIQVNSQMLRDLNSLSNTWTGEAFTNFQTNVQALNPTFEKYAEVINQYADFLNTSADQYEQTEAAVSNETNNIVNDLFK